MVNTLSVVVILTLFALLIQAAPTGRAADSQLKVVTESNNYATDEFDWRFSIVAYGNRNVLLLMVSGITATN